MTASTEVPNRGGPLLSAISVEIVRLVREYTGRGPTAARTTIRDNVVVVMLEDSLTKGEQSLVLKGRSAKVLEIRREFQEAMRVETSIAVAQLTGCTVIAMLSANHIDPDVAAEIFVLDRAPDAAVLEIAPATQRRAGRPARA